MKKARADWEIIAGPAKRMNLPELAFEKVEDIWNFQRDGTGVKIEDFDATGMVSLADNRFMSGGMEIWDPAGGAIAYQENFVTVSKTV